jgi:hypothetical protein
MRAHSDLCNKCLQLMSNTLDRDICGLSKPGALAKDVEISILARYLPSHVQYACRYWVKHLQGLEHDQREKAGLCEKVQVLLEKHFLHWLEALSLTGNFTESSIVLQTFLSVKWVDTWFAPFPSPLLQGRRDRKAGTRLHCLSQLL